MSGKHLAQCLGPTECLINGGLLVIIMTRLSLDVHPPRLAPDSCFPFVLPHLQASEIAIIVGDVA